MVGFCSVTVASCLFNGFYIVGFEGLFMVHPEVSGALSRGDPVVALETTIVTHGMPHPHNVETALEVEQIIRDQGAVPATVGVMDGVIHVGKRRLS